MLTGFISNNFKIYKILTLIGCSEKVFFVRLFISILILIFSFQSWTNAEDIKDFEIEGMSVGDSLLDYMSLEKINISKRNYFDDQRKLNVDGTATTKARMVCFRCNQPIMLDLVSEISSILVFSEEDAVEATKMGDHHRKGLVVVSKNEPDMVEIVEDELLLSLPQSIEQLELLGHRCELRENSPQGEAELKERQFPFAGLRDKIEASKE